MTFSLIEVGTCNPDSEVEILNTADLCVSLQRSVVDRLFTIINKQEGTDPFLSNLSLFEKYSPGWHHFELAAKAVAIGLTGLRALYNDIIIQLCGAAFLTFLMAVILGSKPFVEQRQGSAFMATYVACFALLIMALLCNFTVGKDGLTHAGPAFFVTLAAYGLYCAPFINFLRDVRNFLVRSRRRIDQGFCLDMFIADFAFQLVPKRERQQFILSECADGVLSPVCPGFCWKHHQVQHSNYSWKCQNESMQTLPVASKTKVTPLRRSEDCVEVEIITGPCAGGHVWLPMESMEPIHIQQGVDIEMTEQRSRS
eukprot:TRINITY_DN3546_c0_g1_i2.p1 TRINITY_DN3546_c0_g1~~TRINITY_DN3546_c0_g1_i2.p1  ORF type:complete len:312 (-),score=38.79 TRINITY_DN3546_c0_g1_i2:84-1019(-)